MMKLHFAPNSRAGRIVWLLEELGLEYEINKMAFHPKDLKSDEHRQRHPNDATRKPSARRSVSSFAPLPPSNLPSKAVSI